MSHAIFGIFVWLCLTGSGLAQQTSPGSSAKPATAESSKQTQSQAKSGESAPAASQESDEPSTELEKAIDEFKTVTRELGLRPGQRRRSVRVGPKPEWHGRLFHNLRNDFFDAIPHEIVQSSGDKRPLRRNQFGFNVSGPVFIPKVYNGGRKTFFSLSYEGMRETMGRSFLQTIATEFERRGDWSRTVDRAGNPLPIYDPATTRPNPAFNPSQPVSRTNVQYLRDVFPEAQMPQSRLDPVAQNVLKLYPSPNVARGPFFRNNFFIVSNETNNANGILAKVDHTLDDKHRFSVEANYSNGLNLAPRRIDSAANPGSVDYSSASREGTITHIFTVSPRTVNEIRFSVDSSLRTSEGDTSDFGAQLGLSGIVPGAFPFFNFNDYVNLSRSYPVYRNARHTYRFRDSFSQTIGPHNLRLIGDAIWQQVNTVWPRYPAGTFTLTANQTALPGINNTGHEFASFLLGLADYTEITDILSPSYFRQNYFAAGIFDNYEVSQGLQISVGNWLAWRTPRREKYDRQSTVDLSVPNPGEPGKIGALIFAGHNGVPSTFRPVAFAMEPRISLSWTPPKMPGTVFRASYSRSYSQIPIYYGQWGTQGFTGIRTFLSPNPQLEPSTRLSEGVPAPEFPLPDLRPEAANDTIAHLIPRDHRLPQYDYYQFSVERQLPWGLILRSVAGRTRGRNVLVSNSVANWNAIPIGALQFRDQLNDEDFNRAARPYPQFRGFDVYSSYPGGWNNDDYAYVTAEKRASSGLTLSGQYRFAKSMDNNSSGAQDFHNLDKERALSTYHRPHRLSMTYSYDLPGSLLPFVPGWASKVLADGWTISGSSQVYSGDPVRLRPTFNNTGRVIQYLRVNQVPGVSPFVENQGPSLWFNPAAFDQPPDFTIGNVGRTHPNLLNPPYQNHDLSVRKRFPLSTDRSIELTAVGLNFLNTANWTDPDSEIGPASARNVNAGRIIGSVGGRIIQLGLRINF